MISARHLGLWYLAAPTDSMRSVSISSILQGAQNPFAQKLVRPEDVGFGRRLSKC